jgi:hypothetical protein
MERQETNPKPLTEAQLIEYYDDLVTGANALWEEAKEGSVEAGRLLRELANQAIYAAGKECKL